MKLENAELLDQLEKEISLLIQENFDQKSAIEELKQKLENAELSSSTTNAKDVEVDPQAEELRNKIEEVLQKIDGCIQLLEDE